MHNESERNSQGTLKDKKSWRVLLPILSKMTLFIKARDLAIAWGNDERYWKWTNTVPGCKNEIAELKQVWWFDIRGSIDSSKLNQKTSYGAYLVFAPGKNPAHLDKVKARARFLNDIAEGTDNEAFTVFLTKEKSPGEKGVFAKRRSDGWMELKLGEFYNCLGKDGALDMRVFETSNDYAKSGLYVVGIELRPF